MRKAITCIASSVLLFLASCGGQNDPSVPCGGQDDPYVPSIRLSNASGETYYRFSEDQLERMKKTPLDRDLFLRFIENQWPPNRLRSYCTPENKWDPLEQNLVADRLLFGSWEIPVHNGKELEYDRLYVYVGEETGGHNYYGEAGTKWKRWTYSLNIEKGTDQWVIIDDLPNDLVDNPVKYLPQ